MASHASPASLPMETSFVDSVHERSSTPEASSDDVLDASFHILAPYAWVPRNARRPQSPTTTMLEQLSRTIIEAFCAQNWTHPLLKHAVPNFHAYIDSMEVRTRSLEQHVEFHKWMHHMNPGYVYDVLHVSADVDEEKGMATTWATLKVTGHPLRIQRESITILFWRRRRGQWQTYKQYGMRGVGWFP